MRRFALRLGFLIALTALVAAPAVDTAGAQSTAQWSKVPTPTTPPPGRAGHVLARDAATGQIIMFGGADGFTFFGDTWNFGGGGWTKLNPVRSPSPRVGAVLVYDDARQRLVLFGGFDGNAFLHDTWLWSGTTWRKVRPATSPGRRAAGAAGYDPATERVVMFGGANAGGVLGDTWAWNGTDWKNISTAVSPPPRAAAGMTSLGDRLVLFGGTTAPTAAGAADFLGDTWAWKSGVWKPLKPADSPSARCCFALSSRGPIVLFGGHDETSVYG